MRKFVDQTWLTKLSKLNQHLGNLDKCDIELCIQWLIFAWQWPTHDFSYGMGPHSSVFANDSNSLGKNYALGLSKIQHRDNFTLQITHSPKSSFKLRGFNHRRINKVTPYLAQAQGESGFACIALVGLKKKTKTLTIIYLFIIYRFMQHFLIIHTIKMSQKFIN